MPLSAILTCLGSRWEDHAVKEKVRRWYWCGVLGELYGGAIETRFARDLPEVLEWVAGGMEPSTVRDASFNPARLLTLKTRLSAAYKGLYALLMGEHAYEWLTGTSLNVNTYAAERIDIHHIFPKAWCSGRVDALRMDCIVNKTPISARTNRKIGGRAPSAYLKTIMRDDGPPEAKLNEYLRSHRIEPDTLRADDFEAFFAARKAALLGIIQQAMGQAVAAEVPELEQSEGDRDELLSEDQDETEKGGERRRLPPSMNGEASDITMLGPVLHAHEDNPVEDALYLSPKFWGQGEDVSPLGVVVHDGTEDGPDEAE